jgi:hypothetical protein
MRWRVIYRIGRGDDGAIAIASPNVGGAPLPSPWIAVRRKGRQYVVDDGQRLSGDHRSCSDAVEGQASVVRAA